MTRVNTEVECRDERDWPIVVGARVRHVVAEGLGLTDRCQGGCTFWRCGRPDGHQVDTLG